MIRTSKHSLAFTSKKKLDLLQQQITYYKQQVFLCATLFCEGKLPLFKYADPRVMPSLHSKNSNYLKLVYNQAKFIYTCVLHKVKSEVQRRYIALSKKAGKKHKQLFKRAPTRLRLNLKRRMHIEPLGDNILIYKYFNIRKGKYFDQFLQLPFAIRKGTKNRYRYINLPVKHHKHSRHFLQDWKRLTSIQLKKENGRWFLFYFWQKPSLIKRPIIKEIGIDLGVRKLLTTSSGNVFGKEVYADLRKKTGITAYRRRINRINKALKDFLEKEKPDHVICEDLKINYIPHNCAGWNYGYVLYRLKCLSQSKGFTLTQVPSAFTSQTCCKCGIVRKANRKGQLYSCQCGNRIDADYNAAINILRKGQLRSLSQQF